MLGCDSVTQLNLLIIGAGGGLWMSEECHFMADVSLGLLLHLWEEQNLDDGICPSFTYLIYV